MSTPSQFSYAMLLVKLGAVSGLAFSPAPVPDLDGRPLRVGDVILDRFTGQRVIVLDAERAVRWGYLSYRSSGFWSHLPEEDVGALTITSAAGIPSIVSWQDDEHQFLDVFFESASPRSLGRPGAAAGMTANQFCDWFQNRIQAFGLVPTRAEWESIKDHLQLVFHQAESKGFPRDSAIR